MPEPILILGLLAGGYVALKSKKLTPEQREAYDELKALYRRVPNGMRYQQRTVRIFRERVYKYGGKRYEPFLKLFKRLFEEEFAKKPLPSIHSGDAELKRFRKWLDAYKDKIESRHRNFPLFADTIFEMYANFERGVPTPVENPDPNSITVPVLEMIDEPGKVAEAIMQPVWRPEIISAGLFSKTRDTLTYTTSVHGRPSFVKGDPKTAITEYLKPFGLEGLFAGTVQKSIPEENWGAHALLLAQTRFGKTNVIRWRLSQILPLIAKGKASCIVLEPKGILIEQLLRLASTWEMRDRVVILDPKDCRVSVNLFDKGDGSDEAIEETIARVERVLNNVTTGLTNLQLAPLTYSLRAMFYAEEPGSISLLTRILMNGLQGLKLRGLPDAVAQYFNRNKPGDASATQVVNRLSVLTSNPIFEALLDANHSTFSMYDAMQAGKLIVINASAANEMYARFWIEQVASCVTPRFDAIKAGETLIPTTFVIDEAQTWVKDDLHFASILDKAAEAKIGMLIAAHHMAQITNPTVRGSIYTNCALKFAAHTSEDIHQLCRQMGKTTTDFIGTLRQYEFAHFGPDMERAMRTKLPLVEFDKMPTMTDEQYAQLRADNRKQYHYVRSGKPDRPEPKHPPPQSPADPDDGYE